MHVGINARTFCVDDPDGAVQVGIRSAKNLFERTDIRTSVFGHASVSSTVGGVEVDDTLYVSRARPFGMAWERTVLPLRGTQKGLDVLYSPNANGPMFNTPFSNVICIHDANDQRGLSNRAYQIYKRSVVPRTAKIADAVVTVSEFSKQELCEVYGIPNSKIHVVYNGVEELFLDDSDGSPISLPNKYILYVGAMNPRKNIRGVIKSYRKLQSKYSFQHDLVLVGPENKTGYKELDIEIPDGVITAGYLSKRELKFAYKNADVFLFPSFYEGFGLPPLEAMACGTPVVASDRASLPEVLGEAALFVDPDDSIQIANSVAELLANDSLYKEHVEKGYQRARMFTWESTADRLIDVFQRVV